MKIREIWETLTMPLTQAETDAKLTLAAGVFGILLGLFIQISCQRYNSFEAVGAALFLRGCWDLRRKIAAAMRTPRKNWLPSGSQGTNDEKR